MGGSNWIAFKVFRVEYVEVCVTYKSPFREKAAAAQISDRLAQDQPKVSGKDALARKRGRSFVLRSEGDFPFSALLYHPAATWSSKMLRKGNVELGFPVPVRSLSTAQFL